MIINQDVKNKYNCHKGAAKRRGVGFTLTFEEWCHIWERSGKWEQRGRKKGQYVMSRIGDTGDYAIDNVFIQSSENNVIQANYNKKGQTRVLPKHSEETKRKISMSLMGNKGRLGRKHTEETKRKIKETMKAKANDYCV